MNLVRRPTCAEPRWSGRCPAGSTVAGVLDRDVRCALHARLGPAHQDAGTLVVNELDLCGAVRVDVAVVNGALSGFEIKSARDTLRRLAGQVAVYSEVLDHVTLVAAERHLDEVQAVVPSWWSVYVACKGDGGVRLEEIRPALTNPSPRAASIVQLLWRDEALNALEMRGLDRGVRSKPRQALWDRLVEQLPVTEIQLIVREALKGRTGWRARR